MREALRLLLLCSLHLCMLNASPFPLYNTHSVIKKLWQLKLPAFESFFANAVNAYQIDRDQLLKIEHCQQFVYHCQAIHHFLKSLSVVPGHDALIYSESESLYIENCVSLFSWWRSRTYQTYPQFYALYFDSLARLFVVAMHESWVNREKERYAYYRTQAEQFHAYMSSLIEHLTGSEYEERYARQLARYYDILCFAQSEKDKQATV